MNHASDAPLELGSYGNHETLAANRNNVILRRVFRRQLAQRRAQAFLDDPLLPLLIAANAA